MKLTQSHKDRIDDIWIVFSWILFLGSLIGWPVSQLTFARSEPPTILALSWLAIVVSAMGNLIVAYVNKRVD